MLSEKNFKVVDLSKENKIPVFINAVDFEINGLKCEALLGNPMKIRLKGNYRQHVEIELTDAIEEGVNQLWAYVELGKGKM